MPAFGFIINPSAPTPWLSTATGPRTGNGTPATLTWSIVPDGTPTLVDSTTGQTTPSNFISFMNTTFKGDPSQTNLTKEPWFHLISDSFDRWAQLGGVNYVYEPNDDGATHTDTTGTGSDGVLGVRGDIRLAGFNIDGPNNVLAFTWAPPSGSDIVMDTSESANFGSTTSNSIFFRDTLMHELGHSFGLQHVASTTDNLLMEKFIDTSFDGPQLDEVRGIQFYFGDANEKSHNGQGNGTAALATSLGTITGGSTKSVGSAANVPTQAISPTATDFVSISNAADVDYYSFTVSQPSLLSSLLTPRGGVFTQGAADQNQTPTTFNANARSNLALTIFDTNGTSVLTTANANPAGGTESIANLLLPAAGTYYARVTGADDTIQLYELSLSPTSILLGDYNHDGLVNADDYLLWRRTVGQTVPKGTGADGNFDGQITSADFTIWRLHYGQIPGSGSGDLLSTQGTVPEPTSLGLGLLGLAISLASVARQRRKTVKNHR